MGTVKMISRVAVLLLGVTASCYGGLLGAGVGEGSCAAAPFRSPVEALKWPAGCPAGAECCTEFGYCRPQAEWVAGAFRDCNGVSNGKLLGQDVIDAENAAAALGDARGIALLTVSAAAAAPLPAIAPAPAAAIAAAAPAVAAYNYAGAPAVAVQAAPAVAVQAAPAAAYAAAPAAAYAAAPAAAYATAPVAAYAPSAAYAAAPVAATYNNVAIPAAGYAGNYLVNGVY